MRRSLLFIASALAVACILLSVASPAMAESPRGQIRTGTAHIGLNEHAVIAEFETDRDQIYTPVLSYTVFIIGDNGPIYYDVLLMDEANYTKFNNNLPFGYIAGGSDISMSAQSVSVSNLPLAQHKHYFLVVDNSNQPNGGAIPTQELSVGYVLTGHNMSIESALEDSIAVIFMAIVVIVLIVLVAILVFLLVRSKKRVPAAPATAALAIRPATTEGNCPMCGKPVSPDFMVCPNCGNRLK